MVLFAQVLILNALLQVTVTRELDFQKQAYLSWSARDAPTPKQVHTIKCCSLF